jgi:hypothetical protein
LTRTIGQGEQRTEGFIFIRRKRGRILLDLLALLANPLFQFSITELTLPGLLVPCLNLTPKFFNLVHSSSPKF